MGGTSASSKYGKTEEDSLEHSAMDEGRTSREVSSQASGTREATARSVRTRVNPESRRGGGAGLGGVVTAALPASTASSRRTALTPGSQEDGPVLFSPARGGAASRRHIDGRRARCAGRRAYGGVRASQTDHSSDAVHTGIGLVSPAFSPNPTGTPPPLPRDPHCCLKVRPVGPGCLRSAPGTASVYKMRLCGRPLTDHR